MGREDPHVMVEKPTSDGGEDLTEVEEESTQNVWGKAPTWESLAGRYYLPTFSYFLPVFILNHKK